MTADVWESPRIDKFTARRAQLGKAALRTLSKMGYAKTSLREIAQNSEFSHGVLHYYFRDKLDLILCSVREYKAICVRRYDRAIAESASYDDLMERFVARLSETIRKESALHRLWYDVRAQALFDPAFRHDIAVIEQSLEDMVWRVLSRFADLAGVKLSVRAGVAYGMFDGLFQQALLKHLSGDKRAVPEFQKNVCWLVSQVVPPQRAGKFGNRVGVGRNTHLPRNTGARLS
jgi:AcrR family transcriptional regulator